MAQGIIEISTSELGQLLLLPDGYTSVSAFYDYARGVVCVVVDHKDIPEIHTPKDTRLPRVEPKYRRVQIEGTSEYKTELVDIKIIP